MTSSSRSGLSARAARAWSRRSLANLRDERGAINDINVFPVPDGDTGTNLYFTLLSAHKAVERLPRTATLHDVLSAMALGALRGARGNSGLILSVALQGCADAWEDATGADASALAAALELAALRARQAVAAPVDGTMLTVMDAIAAEARSQAEAGASLDEQIDAVHRTAREALERTQQQLSVLTAAQVVDAGGRGVLELVDALYVIGTGRMPPERSGPRRAATPLDLPMGEERPRAVPEDSGLIGEGGLEIVADLPGIDAEEAKSMLTARLGELQADSLVCSQLPAAVRVHVHVPDEPAARAALALMSSRQPLARLTMERLTSAGEPEPDDDAPLAVAVVKETPLALIFALGGAIVLPLHPGPEIVPDHIDTVLEEYPDRPIVFLANSRPGLTLAKEHLRGLPRSAHHRLTLIRSRALVQGLSALAVYDPAADADELAADMAEAAAATRAGAVRQATYAGTSPAGGVAVGDYMGRIDGRTRVVGSQLFPVACRLMDKLLGGGGELVTLVVGERLPAGMTAAMKSWLGQHYPETEVSLVEGRQEADLLLIGVE